MPRPESSPTTPMPTAMRSWPRWSAAVSAGHSNWVRRSIRTAPAAGSRFGNVQLSSVGRACLVLAQVGHVDPKRARDDDTPPTTPAPTHRPPPVPTPPPTPTLPPTPGAAPDHHRSSPSLPTPVRRFRFRCHRFPRGTVASDATLARRPSRSADIATAQCRATPTVTRIAPTRPAGRRPGRCPIGRLGGRAGPALLNSGRASGLDGDGTSSGVPSIGFDGQRSTFPGRQSASGWNDIWAVPGPPSPSPGCSCCCGSVSMRVGAIACCRPLGASGEDRPPRVRSRRSR